MRNVAKRSFAALILAGVLLLGLLGFLVLYFVKGAAWAVFPGSPHVYTGGNLDSGVITDKTTGQSFQGQPFPEFMQKIIQAEGLVNYINAQ